MRMSAQHFLEVGRVLTVWRMSSAKNWVALEFSLTAIRSGAGSLLARAWAVENSPHI